MRNFIADYGTLVGPIVAIVNGFIALVVAQFYKERTWAKVLLVVSAFILSAGAVTATIVSQQNTVAQKRASDERHREIRDQLGSFMAEGAQIIRNCGDNSTPPNFSDLNAWIAKVQDYLKTHLGDSYAVRLVSAAGVPLNIACNGADEQHNKLFRVGNAVNFHLEQFSSESASWP
jgi:hypothetical protein